MQAKRWWAAIEEEDPITLEPLSKLKFPPFELLYNDPRTGTARRHLFDGHVLAVYIVSQELFLFYARMIYYAH